MPGGLYATARSQTAHSAVLGLAFTGGQPAGHHAADASNHAAAHQAAAHHADSKLPCCKSLRQVHTVKCACFKLCQVRADHLDSMIAGSAPHFAQARQALTPLLVGLKQQASSPSLQKVCVQNRRSCSQWLGQSVAYVYAHLYC